MFTTILNFCSNDLSSFYFDIRKDTIYCDGKKDIKRRAARTVLKLLFEYLVRWFAPSLVFTCEEAWKSYGKKTSIHLENFKQKKKEKDFDKGAEDLRLATRHLGMIVGKVDVEEILGTNFNDFCIGK